MNNYIIIGGIALAALLVFIIFTPISMNQSTLVTTPTVDPHAQHNMPVVQSHRSFTLQSDAATKTFQPNIPTSYAFSVVDDQGNTIKDFATVHEKNMHLIIVRQDLQGFQHLHPEFNQATGQFTLKDLVFPTDGQYRIFADFAPMSAQRGAHGMPLSVVISEDVTAGNLANYSPQPVVDSPRSQTVEGYTIQLATTPSPITAEASTSLTFTVQQNGKIVTNLEKYLGALGHAVVLREGDLEFLHTHALDENTVNQDGKVDFAVKFPTAGKYKVFVQFQHQGKVITSDFVVTAEASTAGPNEGNPTEEVLDHGMHH